jgi:hypothetical protein
MVNTSMTHVFKHPKFYRIPRDKSDQVISKSPHDGESERAPGPGHKPQAPSSKHQASSTKRQAFEPTCSIAKRQASQPE